MCPERSATSAYDRVCHAGRSVRLDFMADTTFDRMYDLKVVRLVIMLIYAN